MVYSVFIHNVYALALHTPCKHTQTIDSDWNRYEID